MPVLPKWLLGKHIQTIQIVPQLVDVTTGVTSQLGSTIYSIKGRVEAVRVNNRVTKENIMSTDAVFENNVVLYDGMDIEITEILINGSATSGVNRPPVLPLLPTLADLFAITFGRGQQTYGPVYMTRGDLGDGVGAPGKNTVSMAFSFADVKAETTGNPSIGIPYV